MLCQRRKKEKEEILKDNNKEWKEQQHRIQKWLPWIHIYIIREKFIYFYFNDGSILFDVEFLYNLENKIKLKHLIDSNSNIQLLKLKILVGSASIFSILSALCFFFNFNLFFFKDILHLIKTSQK